MLVKKKKNDSYVLTLSKKRYALIIGIFTSQSVNSDDKEMYKSASCCLCTVVLLILPYCFLSFWSLLKLPISTFNNSTRGKKLMGGSNCNPT